MRTSEPAFHKSLQGVSGGGKISRQRERRNIRDYLQNKGRNVKKERKGENRREGEKGYSKTCGGMAAEKKKPTNTGSDRVIGIDLKRRPGEEK